MFDKLLLLSQSAMLIRPEQAKETVAEYAGQKIDRKQFNQEVSELSAALEHCKDKHFALYYEQAYPFAVALFALLHSGKQVWIAANNKTATAEKLQQQGCLLIGEWQGRELLINTVPCDVNTLKTLAMDRAQITIFTSGSSGQAKQILKTLQQFQNEIETLEQYWGKLVADADVYATVSHQHIYGLLFRVLWPLAAGRCFNSNMYLSPEPLLKAINKKPAVWVSSPAQLKRLDPLSPWKALADLRVIFSSGGALPLVSAKQIDQFCQQKVLEIYGSSETGGIAWRQVVINPFWTTFKNIKITLDQQQKSYLSSPYLNDNQTVILDDKIKLHTDDCFELLGRIDRIVKVEEKRLSLDQMEQTLNTLQWIADSYLLLNDEKREKIAATLVLTKQGEAFLQQQGRAELIKKLRKQLMHSFETLVLPRQWLIMQALPLTAQGKVNHSLLEQLFRLDNTRFPQVLCCQLIEQQVDLHLRVLPGLIYFLGHFPQQAILPGVTQLAWVEHFGKMFFNITQPFLSMEVIKFKKIIRPNELIEMKLIWNPDKSKLYFEIISVTESHSSGRMVYGKLV